MNRTANETRSGASGDHPVAASTNNGEVFAADGGRSSKTVRDHSRHVFGCRIENFKHAHPRASGRNHYSWRYTWSGTPQKLSEISTSMSPKKAITKTAAVVGMLASIMIVLALASAYAQWKMTREERRDPEISAWLNEVTPEELDALRSEMDQPGSSPVSLDVTRAFEAEYRQGLSYGELAKKLVGDGFRIWAGFHHQDGLLRGRPADDWFISYYLHVEEYYPPKEFPIKVWVLLGHHPGREEKVPQLEVAVSILPDGI